MVAVHGQFDKILPRIMTTNMIIEICGKVISNWLGELQSKDDAANVSPVSYNSNNYLHPSSSGNNNNSSTVINKFDDDPKPWILDGVVKGLSLAEEVADANRGLVGLLERAAAAQADDVHVHAHAAHALLVLIRKDDPSLRDYLNVCLPYVTHYLHNSDIGVYGKWMEVALEMVEMLPSDACIQSSLYQLAASQCQLGASTHHKLGAAALLGKLAANLDAHLIGSEVWPLLQSLSQDVCGDVRAAVCHQLAAMFRGGSAELGRRDLLPCLIEFSRDEHPRVRAHSVDTVVQLIPHVSRDLLSGGLVPLVLSMCERANESEDDATFRLADQLGTLVQSLFERDVWNEGLASVVVGLYMKLAPYSRTVMSYNHCTDQQFRWYEKVRCACAENLHVMVELGGVGGVRPLHNLCAIMSVDPSAAVRAALARNMHLVIRSSLKQAGGGGVEVRSVKRAVLDLIKDSNETVMHGIFSHLTETVTLLASSGQLNKYQCTELGEALVHSLSSRVGSRNWRLYSEMCEQIGISATSILTSDFIHAHLYPLLYNTMLHASAWPVREAACGSLVRCLRYNLMREQRVAIRKALYDDLCRSESCHRRVLYIKLCRQALGLFSKEYISKHFLQRLLSLEQDCVSNVRLMLAAVLGEMYRVTLSERVFVTLNTMLQSDRDRDVTEALQAAQTVIAACDPVSYSESERNENLRRLEEERRLLTLSGGQIANAATPASATGRARQPARGHNVSSVSRSGSSSRRQERLGPGPAPPSNTPLPLSQLRGATGSATGAGCTCSTGCHGPRVAMEISWLNLESDLRRELHAHALTNAYSAPGIFSSVFDKEFYRDAGVLPDDILYHAPTVTTVSPSISTQHSIQFVSKLNKRVQPPKLLSQSRRSKSFVLPSPSLAMVSKAVDVKTTRIPISVMNTNRRSMDVSHWSARLDGRSLALGDGPVSRLPIRKKTT